MCSLLGGTGERCAVTTAGSFVLSIAETYNRCGPTLVFTLAVGLGMQAGNRIKILCSSWGLESKCQLRATKMFKTY